MERLTEFLNGEYIADCIYHNVTDDNGDFPYDGEGIDNVVSRLGGYEDAEEQGLLLRLPIAEGTTVYVIDNNTDACTDDCKYFNIGYCCEDYCSKPNVVDDVYPQLSDIPVCKKQYLEVSEIKPKLDWIFRNRDNFGKTVFLTKAEAEQKLKEMEDK